MKSQIVGLKVASIIFMLVAVAHVSRLFFHWTVAVGGREFGIWPSMVVAFVALVLSIWMGSLACSACQSPQVSPEAKPH